MIDVIALVERELGEEVEQVTPLTGMVGNASLVRTPGRQLVLKACREQDSALWRRRRSLACEALASPSRRCSPPGTRMRSSLAHHRLRGR